MKLEVKHKLQEVKVKILRIFKRLNRPSQLVELFVKSPIQTPIILQVSWLKGEIESETIKSSKFLH